MIRFFDTHAHFDADAEKTASVLARAKAEGVTLLAAVGGSDDLNRAAILASEIAAGDAERYPQVITALGFDREQDVSRGTEVRDLVAGDWAQASAIGEIGLDYHYSPETANAQESLFASELAAAKELNLPVVIHTRDADDATLGILDETDSHFGIIHCYTGSVDFERKLLDRGFMISISGIVTFRAADNVREAAKYAPEDRLLVETDSPFLAPIPMRGRENESAFVSHTVKFLAEQRGVTVEHLAEVTMANGKRIFKLHQ